MERYSVLIDNKDWYQKRFTIAAPSVARAEEWGFRQGACAKASPVVVVVTPCK